MIHSAQKEGELVAVEEDAIVSEGAIAEALEVVRGQEQQVKVESMTFMGKVDMELRSMEDRQQAGLEVMEVGVLMEEMKVLTPTGESELKAHMEKLEVVILMELWEHMVLEEEVE